MGTPLQKRSQVSAAGGWGGRTDHSRSVAFTGADTEYFSRAAPGSSATNLKELTASVWIRNAYSPDVAAGDWVLFGGESSSANFFMIRLNVDTNGAIEVVQNTTSTNLQAYLLNQRGFDDLSAWYHLLFSLDTSQAVANDRMRVWINGQELTYTWLTTPAPNLNLEYAQNRTQYINRGNYFSAGNKSRFNGMMSQPAVIVGKSIQQGDFAATDFYNTQTAGNQTYVYPRTHSDLATLVNLGEADYSYVLGNSILTGVDDSVNSNDFTVNGTLYEMYDTPTDPGMTWNWSSGANNQQLNCRGGKQVTFTGGNAQGIFAGTMFSNSGVKYIEMQLSGTFASGNGCGVGIVSVPWCNNASPSGQAKRYEYIYDSGGGTINDGTDGSYTTAVSGVATYAGSENAIIGIEVDFDNSTVRFTKNGTLVNSRTTDAPLKDRFFTIMMWDRTFDSVTQIADLYVHEDEWTYTPNDVNATPWTQAYHQWDNGSLTQPNEVAYFGTEDHSGAKPASYTGIGFQGDFGWWKQLGGTANHVIYNSSRGDGHGLQLPTVAAEVASSDFGGWDADGYTLNTIVDWGTFSASSAWQMILKCNGGTTVANSDGDINSTVQVAPEGHFSIVRYTGNATAAQTVGHGLSRRPGLIIIKAEDSGAVGWPVWSRDMDNNYLSLHANVVEATDSDLFTGDVTDAHFGVGINLNVNGSGNKYVAFCFANVPGICACGSRLGDGSADRRIAFGADFSPDFIMFKREGGANDSWYLADSKRSNQTDGGYNPGDNFIYADSTSGGGTSPDMVNLQGQGMVPMTSNGGINPNGSWVTFLMLGGVKGGGGLPPVPARF